VAPLGLDRNSGTVAHLFDERDDAVRDMIADVIETAKTAGKPTGICGQAPSDYPDFARWLVEQGITHRFRSIRTRPLRRS
jgi:pyruvate, water dikinase